MTCDWPECDEHTGGFDSENEESSLPQGWLHLDCRYNITEDDFIQSVIVLCPHHRFEFGSQMHSDDLQVQTESD